MTTIGDITTTTNAATTAAAVDTCQTLPQPLPVAEAHQVMQQHLRCLTDTCPSRRAAVAVLVGEGRYVLAAG